MHPREVREAVARSVEPAGDVAARYGMSVATVHRLRLPRDGRPNARHAGKTLSGAWRAACMDDDEWALWVAKNPVGLSSQMIADRPCHDCPTSFALEMRALGRCNGSPRGEETKRSDEMHETTPTPAAVIAGAPGRPSTGVALELVAPCPTCVHAPVCGLREKLERVKGAEVVMPRLPDALTVVVRGDVTCEHYTATPKPKRPHTESEAVRAARVASAAKAREAKAAKAAAGPAQA